MTTENTDLPMHPAWEDGVWEAVKESVDQMTPAVEALRDTPRSVHEASPSAYAEVSLRQLAEVIRAAEYARRVIVDEQTRTAGGLSQRKLAAAAGVSPGAVQHWARAPLMTTGWIDDIRQE